jgi:putative ABC transport system permease protein
MTAILDTFAMALATLRANPTRSFLTLLGIVIGAATVVAMMSLTEGLRNKVQTDLSFLGAGHFNVTKFPNFGGPSTDWGKYRRRKDLTLEQGRAIEDNCPHVERVSPKKWAAEPEKVSTQERSTRPTVRIVGTTPGFEQMNGYPVGDGRFLTDIDVSLARRVADIGADVADVLFPGRDPVGEKIRIRSGTFTVIGVLARKGSDIGGGSQDSIVVVPLSTFSDVFGKNFELVLGVKAVSPEVEKTAQDEAVAQLRRMRRVPAGEENDFEIYGNDSMGEMFDKLATTIGVATFGVCALALLVGGIGIMNIMLVSVVERTREIGIRKALGARRRRVLSQFVVEAIALSLVGGVIGVALGCSVAVGAREIYGVPASIPAWAVALAMGSATGCGLLFGIYPAVRASRLDPVEAMRAE